MTIECAIKEIKEDIDLYIPLHGTINDVDRELPDGRLITALEMAIASLEAWGKVREEIVHLHDWAFDREEILRIIDKYKASPTGAEGRNKE